MGNTYTSPRQKRKAPVPSMQGSKSTKKATTASTMKSKLAASQMEAIISGIKQKYNQQSIANMSQEELQSEVMNEIMNSSVAKS
jgi:transcriptional regulator NrdR family protein